MQLALSASSPIFRGYLADIDCRWPVISGSVDDRTDEERGKKVREKKLTIKLFAIAKINFSLAPQRGQICDSQVSL